MIYKNIKVKIFENGKKPVYQRENDACMDCYSADNLILKKNSRALVKLGFALELPENCEAVIRPRSGLSKKGIDVAIGTIDSNYRGQIMANVINNSDDDFEIHLWDRICQMAIREISQFNLIESNELSATERGSDGFGSSGV